MTSLNKWNINILFALRFLTINYILYETLGTFYKDGWLEVGSKMKPKQINWLVFKFSKKKKKKKSN